MSILHTLFPSARERRVKSYRKAVESINALEASLSGLDNAGILAKSQALKAQIQQKAAELLAAKSALAAEIDKKDGKAPAFSKADIKKVLDPFLPRVRARPRIREVHSRPAPL